MGCSGCFAAPPHPLSEPSTYSLSCQEGLLKMAHQISLPLTLILLLQSSIQVPHPHCLPGTAFICEGIKTEPLASIQNISEGLSQLQGFPFFSLSILASLTLLKCCSYEHSSIIITCKSNLPPGRNSKDNGQGHG